MPNLVSPRELIDHLFALRLMWWKLYMLAISKNVKFLEENDFNLHFYFINSIFSLEL